MSEDNILVFGASGQVGSALVRLLGSRAIPVTRAEVNLLDIVNLEAALSPYSPSAVFNAAAYTNVDGAETEEPEAFLVNAEAPGLLATWCAARNIPLVHFSTDYVFPGTGEKPWVESDPTGPVNYYGQTKDTGEFLIEEAGGKYLIIRTSWVFDATGKNFVNTMLRLAAEREELKVVHDQVGAPTYAPHLAKAAIALYENAIAQAEFPTGIYHLAGGGETSWHGFAEAIIEGAKEMGAPSVVKSITPILTEEYPTPAKRPLNSRLNCEKAKTMFGIALPDWTEGLNECLREKYARK